MESDPMAGKVSTDVLAKRLNYNTPRMINRAIVRLGVPHLRLKRKVWVDPAEYYAALEREAVRQVRTRGRPRRAA